MTLVRIVVGRLRLKSDGKERKIKGQKQELTAYIHSGKHSMATSFIYWNVHVTMRLIHRQKC